MFTRSLESPLSQLESTAPAGRGRPLAPDADTGPARIMKGNFPPLVRLLALVCVVGMLPSCRRAAGPTRLWHASEPPPAAAIPVIEGVRFSVIKAYEFPQDGYRFLHGVGLAWHAGRLYASFGHNRGGENTATEEARGRASDDDGVSWGEVFTIDPGEEPDLAVSHGVFLMHAGRLHAFMGAFRGEMQEVHTRGYLLDDATGRWEPRGVLIEGGFWPLQEPVPLDDGNWIMAGMSARGDAAGGGRHPPAVAISHGADFSRWDLVEIPLAEDLGPDVWGESGVIVAGSKITNIARYGSGAVALVAVSDDYGRRWTPSRPSNLPMATSKPYAGRLSTGEPYLIGTTTADSGNLRSPLTIALGSPGGSTFSRILVIRRGLHAGPGESHPEAQFAYPYAVEHAGHLYVAYSNSGGGAGRVGTGRELWNNNSAELAVIPLAALRADRGSKPPASLVHERPAASSSQRPEAHRGLGVQSESFRPGAL
jgi:hypothetical protein